MATMRNKYHLAIHTAIAICCYISVILVACIVIILPVWANTIRPVKSLLEMRRERVMIQKWDLSCGAAALGTLLNYQHGDPIPERDIANGLMQRQEYISNPKLIQIRQGFSLLDLKRYADKRGYNGIGLGKLTLQNLAERAPIMVPINLHGYNHFVIFRGIYKDRVLLADPAWGNRTMRIDRFEKAWLDYPDVGKVGFIVSRRDSNKPPNQLIPNADDFYLLR